MRNCLRLVCLVAASCVTLAAQTPIDVQPIKELKPTGSLGTCGYAPSPPEKPFLDKLNAKERETGSFMADYNIHKKSGFVSWYGVVRKISRLAEPDSWELLLEHKYFDGMTDCHIMLVSISGSGDFAVRVQGKDLPIPALSLVRVYGKVKQQENGIPTIDAEFIRVWPWMTFTFTDLGADDRTNPRWKKECSICKGDRVYRPYPDEKYYRDALGDPEQYGLLLK
jgi:hypothetical protein